MSQQEKVLGVLLLIVSPFVLFAFLGLSDGEDPPQPLLHEVVEESEEAVNGASMKRITANVDDPLEGEEENEEILSLTAQEINEEKADPGFFSFEYDIVAIKFRNDDVGLIGLGIVVNSERGIDALGGSSYFPCGSSPCPSWAGLEDLPERIYDLDSYSVRTWTVRGLENMGYSPEESVFPDEDLFVN